MQANVHYSLLGSVRALRGGTELDLGPPKRLALLALLLLRAPGPMTLSEAVDILWDEEPPVSAVNVVHRHIGALRRSLEPALRSRKDAEHLVRAADGYRLLVDASSSDLLRFRELRTRAQAAAGGGDPARAVPDFTAALRIWRSPVVAAGTSVARHPVFTSVGHEFVATAKEAADVVLDSAPEQAEYVLTALRAAAGAHPFDEALHSRIIRVLGATGRQAEALQHFESVRRTLDHELGVEPGPDLSAARRQLLRPRSSPTPGGPVRAPGAGARPPTAPTPFIRCPCPRRPWVRLDRDMCRQSSPVLPEQPLGRGANARYTYARSMSTSPETAVANLIAQYAERVDAGDFAGVGELFQDATFLGSGTPAVGRDAVEGMLRESVIRYEDGTPRTHHMTTNLVIDVDPQARTATARSYVTVFQALPGLPLQAVAAGTYNDRFSGDGGHWRFTHRQVRIRLVGDVSRHLRPAPR
ncbi:BTAD domain-containing putative transcriptional regulator [Streptacidiphilus carbonis]|uniref:BTAD domain-containing putative transcriptional regulator n=1 Tax=Streptacidiphilus carbonis TaxID=105422 RepID=UPI001F26BCB7|nr:BTAD domain-containing putative transcriptional regulator [Streptacidiphilus carbonis]